MINTLAAPIEKLISGILSTEYRLTKKVNTRLWQNQLGEILSELEQVHIADGVSPTDLKTAPPFRGLMMKVFEPNNYYPSCTDLAIAAAVSIISTSQNRTIRNENLADFSFSFAGSLTRRLIGNTQLLKLFSRYGKHANQVCRDCNRDHLLATLHDKKTFFDHYFKSFEDRHFSQEISIRYPGYVNRQGNEQDSSITIKVDPADIREGFFLLGFDYSSSTKSESLAYATRDEGYEYWGDTTTSTEGQVIWVRPKT